jgi:predicted Zn-dependent peptidase
LSDTARTTLLENGVRVVTEASDAVSTAVGVWIEAGSRHEERRHNGASHFLEHLVFKGTTTRSAFGIADDIERLGGSINGFTTKEYTCYHARTLAEHASTAVEVLADLVRNPLLRAEDVEIERDVILQEIFDAEETPEDFVHDYFLEQYWPGHPLGWPVLGTKDTIAALSRDVLSSFLGDRYRPDRLIVAAAGGLDHDHFVDLCRRGFEGLKGEGSPPITDRPDFSPGVFHAPRDLEQVHMVIGFPGIAYTDPRREVADVLVSALGGGMSSRLFQEVRERRGLAYSVYAFQSGFRDIGYTGVYAATSREHLTETAKVTLEEILSVARDGLEAGELERTKSHLVGSIPLSLESTENRMFRLARNQMYFGQELAVKEVVRAIEAVTMTEVIELAREVFAFDRLGVALVGDADGDALPLPLA